MDEFDEVQYVVNQDQKYTPPDKADKTPEDRSEIKADFRLSSKFKEFTRTLYGMIPDDRFLSYREIKCGFDPSDEWAPYIRWTADAMDSLERDGYVIRLKKPLIDQFKKVSKKINHKSKKRVYI